MSLRYYRGRQESLDDLWQLKYREISAQDPSAVISDIRCRPGGHRDGAASLARLGWGWSCAHAMCQHFTSRRPLSFRFRLCGFLER